MVDTQQHTPGQGYSFALEQAFENYAVAFEQYARDLFGGFSVPSCSTNLSLSDSR